MEQTTLNLVISVNYTIVYFAFYIMQINYNSTLSDKNKL